MSVLIDTLISEINFPTYLSYVYEYKSMPFYRTKIVNCNGNKIKIKSYTFPIFLKCSLGRKNKNFSIKTTTDKCPFTDDRRTSNISRAKNNLINLIDSNICKNVKFLTLTFKENLTDLKESSRLFNIFLTKLKKYLPNFKYISVREFQKRGAIHYHLLVFVETKLDINLFKKLWSYGYIKLNRIDNISNVSRYVSKYIIKSINSLNNSVSTTKSNRLYSCSHNLVKPTIIKLFDFYSPSTLHNCEYKVKYDIFAYENGKKTDIVANTCYYYVYNQLSKFFSSELNSPTKQPPEVQTLMMAQ